MTRKYNKLSWFFVVGLALGGCQADDPGMNMGWLAPLILLLLVIVLVLLWFELRRRRQHEGDAVEGLEAVAEAEETPAPVVDLPDDDEDPPELQAVREALAKARAEDEAAALAVSVDAMPASAQEAEVADEPAEEQSLADEAEPEPSGERALPESAEVEAVATEMEDAPDEAPVAMAAKPTPDTAEDLADAVDEEPEQATELEATEHVSDGAEDQPEGGLEAERAEAKAEAAPPAQDQFDEDGRLILTIEMGDAVAPAEVARRMELAVTKQWPLPVVHGFRPGQEKLILRYDGDEPDDVVILPTVENTWQVNLGGRPVVQVGCADGAEALAGALSINP